MDLDVQICSNDSLEIGQSAENDLSYAWSTGDTTSFIKVNRTGTYELSVGKDGCSAKDTIAVTSISLPSTDFVVEESCFGDSTIFQLEETLIGNDFEFLWDFGDSSSLKTNQNLVKHFYTKMERIITSN